MIAGERVTGYGSDSVDNAQHYRSVVGALQCLAITRPEISYSVNRVCQFMQNPLEAHWKAIKRILRYIAGTFELGLHLVRCHGSSLDITAFSDANWAQTQMTEDPLQGTVFF